jgi:hypothetical protein
MIVLRIHKGGNTRRPGYMFATRREGGRRTEFIAEHVFCESDWLVLVGSLSYGGGRKIPVGLGMSDA